MSDTSNVLDLIDGAIEAWETGDDAMRWTPEPPRAEPNVRRVTIGGIDVTPYVSSIEIRGAEPGLTIIDEVHTWMNQPSFARAYLTGRVSAAFGVPMDLLVHGNAYIDLRPRRAKLRAMHTAYRAKTRNRNRRTR